jgi:hypothetical protein
MSIRLRRQRSVARVEAPGVDQDHAITVVIVIAMACHALPAMGASIEGTVREAGTRRPIPGASVAVVGSDIATVTDDTGAFVLAFEEQGRTAAATLDVDTAGYERLLVLVMLRTDRATTSRDLYLVPRPLGETRVRERRSRDNVARGAHRIEGNEVHELPGTYGDPAKAIENFPGMGRVLLSQGSLFIRGASPAESAVFVDDYEIPDLYHYTGSTSVINSAFVESVELVPGAFSARYGRSTGGIVTLKTNKLPTDDVHGFAKLDVIDGGAYVGVPIDDQIAVGASARRSWLDAIRNTQKAIQGTGDSILLTPTYWDYQLKLDWDTAPGHELVVFAFGSGDREEYASDGEGALEPFFQSKDSDFYRVSLRYSHNLGSGFTHTMTPVVGYARTALLEQGGVRLKNGETFDAQLRDEIVWRSGSSRVIVGVDATARHDSFTYGGLLAPTDVRSIEEVELAAIVARERTTQQTWRVTTGAYIEATLEALDRVFLTPGLRIESSLLEETAHVSLEPRVAGSWQLLPGALGTLVRAGAGSFSRPPEPDELAAARGEGFDLAPQQALHFQVGLEQALGDRMTASATFFNIWRNELTSKSASFPAPERFGTRSVNDGGSGHSVGGEALLRVGVPRRYFAWLTYSLARHERFDGGSALGVPYPYPAPFDTTHLLGVVGQLQLPAGFRVGARYRVASGMPADRIERAIFDGDTGRFVAQPAPKGGERFPVFQAVDVRVDWSTVLDFFELDVYADLVNVNTLFGRPVEGVLYNFDFTSTQDRLGLPLIPAIGAKATF